MARATRVSACSSISAAAEARSRSTVPRGVGAWTTVEPSLPLAPSSAEAGFHRRQPTAWYNQVSLDLDTAANGLMAGSRVRPGSIEASLARAQAARSLSDVPDARRRRLSPRPPPRVPRRRVNVHDATHRHHGHNDRAGPAQRRRRAPHTCAGDPGVVDEEDAPTTNTAHDAKRVRIRHQVTQLALSAHQTDVGEPRC
jgi:hypothetical protein